jgi:GT2 family glycosyltransferase
VSIVIPTLSQSGALTEVLEAIGSPEQAALGTETVVVLDANTEPEAIEHIRPGDQRSIRVIRASRPGASAARNAGWRAATSDLILFLDDDIVPTPALVPEHLRWHANHPEPEVAVLGRVRWSRRVKTNPFMRWLERGIQFDYDTISGIEVGWGRLYSCNLSIKRELLERAGGFDESRFPYGYEDTELARRLASRGLRLLYNRAAVGEHLKTETLDGWRRNLRRIAVAEQRFVTLYPDAAPYFYDLFRAAASAPPARGRAARLARWVSPDFPFLGPRVWRSYDAVCRQRLAPEFLTEWDAALASEANADRTRGSQRRKDSYPLPLNAARTSSKFSTTSD